MRRKLLDLTDSAVEKHVQNSICSQPRNQVNKGLIIIYHSDAVPPFLSVESGVIDIKSSLLAVQRINGSSIIKRVTLKNNTKIEQMNFLEITRKILKAPYDEGGCYIDKPGCRKSMFAVQLFRQTTLQKSIFKINLYVL